MATENKETKAESKGIKNPREIEVVKTKSTYRVPTYKVENTGLVDAANLEVKFVKGNKADDTIFRQEGVMVETLAQLIIDHLKANNVGELENENTTNAILHFETGLYKLSQRSEDREKRNAQGTYQK